MNKTEFLQGLQSALSGNVPPETVRENLRYYSDYIRSEVQKGRSERDVMEELGDPRLIARTIMDATPGAGEGLRSIAPSFHSDLRVLRMADMQVTANHRDSREIFLQAIPVCTITI